MNEVNERRKSVPLAAIGSIVRSLLQAITDFCLLQVYLVHSFDPCTVYSVHSAQYAVYSVLRSPTTRASVSSPLQ